MVVEHGPWKIEESTRKYKSPWIEVYEDKVIQPNGDPGIFSTVKMKQGVCVLPIDDNGYVYLAKEFQYAVGKDCINASCGGIEDGEVPIDAAKRELKEELGIEANEWTKLGVVNPFTSQINAPMHLFLVKSLNFTKPSPDETEQIEMVKVKFEKAVEMVMDDKIHQGPSAIIILKAKEYLNKNNL